MKKTLFICLLFPTFLMAQIGSKVPSGKTSLSGKWTNNQFGFAMILQLNQDGSGSFDGEKITYTSTSNILSVKQDGETTRYNYSLQSGKLTLSGGDLDAPLSFSRDGTSVSGPAPNSITSVKPGNTKNTAAGLTGTWSGNGETMVFQAGGKGLYNGVAFNYTTSGDVLTISSSSGSSDLQFAVNGNYLTLSGNGTTVMLQRGTAYSAPSGNNQTYGQNSGGSYSQNSGGGIDQSIVGKWCWVNTSSTYSSSYNSSKCIVINGNGTYEYYAEGSISGYGGGGYGGSSSQSSDSGTWRVSGNVIQVQSRSEGNKTYSFQKRNHPKNGDPMIVIDGDTYVSYYKKSPW